MPNRDWETFQRCALTLVELHDELQLAVSCHDHEFAKTIACRIKDAESIRDRLLCRLSRSPSPAA
jgi:hypothetical protein